MNLNHNIKISHNVIKSESVYTLVHNDRSEIPNQKYSNDKYNSTEIILAKYQNVKTITIKYQTMALRLRP